MGRIVLAIVGGYVLGRMSTGQSFAQAIAGGISDLKNLVGKAQAALPPATAESANVQVVEPSWRED